MLLSSPKSSSTSSLWHPWKQCEVFVRTLEVDLDDMYKNWQFELRIQFELYSPTLKPRFQAKVSAWFCRGFTYCSLENSVIAQAVTR